MRCKSNAACAAGQTDSWCAVAIQFARARYISRHRGEGGGRTAAQRFVTIGRFGSLTPELARKQSRTILGSVALGEDPADARRTKRLEMRISG